MYWIRGEGLPPGTVVHGRYEVVRTLGRGGMGAVYLVKDRALGDRLCAMKAMHWDGRTPQERNAAMRRLGHEAEILSHLSHPGIPQVYDRFVEYGCYYLVMEFVAGVNTGELLERYQARYGVPLPEREVVRWALQICDVLDYLHRHEPSVLHRDLKPANLIVLKGGRVKVVDFGIARAVTTVRGTTIGTIGYAPPEQYRGQTEVRSDLYALGASLHHLLSGRNPQAEAPFDFPPLRSLAPGVSRELEELVASLVAMNPDDRPSSAREVGERLSALYPRVELYRLHEPVRDLDELIDEALREAPGVGESSGGGAFPVAATRTWAGSEVITAEQIPALTSRLVPAERLCQVEDVAFSPDGRFLAAGSAMGEVLIWRTADGRTVGRLPGFRGGPVRIAFSPDGEVLATGYADGSMQLWRLADGQALLTLRSGGGPVWGVGFGGDGQLLGTVSGQGVLSLWRLSDGQLVRVLPLGRSGEYSLAFAPDGMLMAVGGGGELRFWHAGTGHQVRSWRCPAFSMPVLRFSANGDFAIAGCGDGMIRIWRYDSGQLLYTLPAGPGPVRALAVTQGGLLAAGGRQVKMWDMWSGRPAGVVQETRYPVQALAFSPDDRLMASGSYEGLRLWSVRVK
ncbi:MAG TPA: serine/threonine-protein kinase [Symbiobacteriaceae bacterium]